MSSRVAALLFGALLFALPRPAHALYCRAKACTAKYADVWKTEPPCQRDSFGCLIAGKPLFWPQTCISFSVQKDAAPSDGIDYDAAVAVIGGAFQTWLDAECFDGGTPSFAIVDAGPVECTEVEYNEQHGNANIFMFRETDWPHPGGNGQLALTTLTFNVETGEVLDADVEINSTRVDFTLGDEFVGHDLASTLTHEIGHFLGLSHDSDPETTMWWVQSAGDTAQRTLHAEDIAGICEIYPPDRSVDTERCGPRHGFSTACVPGEEKLQQPSSGCGVTRKANAGGNLGALVAALSAGFVARRRHRARR
jgi:hypothetical protein